jgi:hypothetical protein
VSSLSHPYNVHKCFTRGWRSNSSKDFAIKEVKEIYNYLHAPKAFIIHCLIACSLLVESKKLVLGWKIRKLPAMLIASHRIALVDFSPAWSSSPFEPWPFLRISRISKIYENSSKLMAKHTSLLTKNTAFEHKFHEVTRKWQK